MWLDFSISKWCTLLLGHCYLVFLVNILSKYFYKIFVIFTSHLNNFSGISLWSSLKVKPMPETWDTIWDTIRDTGLTQNNYSGLWSKSKEIFIINQLFLQLPLSSSDDFQNTTGLDSPCFNLSAPVVFWKSLTWQRDNR